MFRTIMLRMRRENDTVNNDKNWLISPVLYSRRVNTPIGSNKLNQVLSTRMTVAKLLALNERQPVKNLFLFFYFIPRF